MVEFTLEIVICDHFSSLFFGREDKVIVEMQEALKKSQGGILEGRTVDHLILNYNQDEIIHRERKVVNKMVHFFGEWTREEREVVKLASLLIDEIPKSVFSYYTKWRDFIARDASRRCGFQIIVSDITVQHLMVFFAHRCGKGNLGKKGKKHSAVTRAKMSETEMGKKHSAATRAKISETKMGKKGKKHSAATRAKISETKMGKKHSTATRAKISETKMGKKCKKHSAATRAKMNETKMGKKHSTATRAKISETKMGKKGKMHSAATHAKMSETWMRKKHSAKH